MPLPAHELSTELSTGDAPEPFSLAEEMDREWALEEPLRKTHPTKRAGVHFTYVIASYADRVKVGHSNRPKGRLCEMQVGSPIGLRLAHTWRSDRERAKLLERQLHAALNWVSVRGEWFDIGEAAVIAMGDLFLADRVDDAIRLRDLVRARREMAMEEQWLRGIWRHVPPKERLKAEEAAKLRRDDLTTLIAQNDLEARELGLWAGRNSTSRWVQRDLEFLRRTAARPLANPVLPITVPTLYRDREA